MVLNQGQFPAPRGHLTVSGDTSSCHNLGGMLWHLMCKGWVITKLPALQAQLLRHRIIWWKVSVVPRLRNSTLEAFKQGSGVAGHSSQGVEKQPWKDTVKKGEPVVAGWSRGHACLQPRGRALGFPLHQAVQSTSHHEPGAANLRPSISYSVVYSMFYHFINLEIMESKHAIWRLALGRLTGVSTSRSLPSRNVGEAFPWHFLKAGLCHDCNSALHTIVSCSPRRHFTQLTAFTTVLI